MALHNILSYHGEPQDAAGMPLQYYRYMVVADAAMKAGTTFVTIMSLSADKAAGMGQNSNYNFIADGDDAAGLDRAEQWLDGQHPGLKKLVGPRQ